ncbi:MAG: hypothetical protein Q9181_001924 [Wetmoreana brouardii]
MMASHSPTGTTLFILDFGTAHDPNDPLHRGRLIRTTTDGTSFVPMIDSLYLPDSIDILRDDRRLYWTCMGISGAQDGSIRTCLIDGSERKQIFEPCFLNTPKQLVLGSVHRKIHLCDREGLRILRCDLDGSHAEDLVRTGDPSMMEQKSDRVSDWPYTGKRARFTGPRKAPIGDAGDGSSEPILTSRTALLQVIDKTLNVSSPSCPILVPPPYDVLARTLRDPIGLSLDLRDKKLFVADLGGSVYSMNLNGTQMRKMYEGQGTYTGVTLYRMDEVQ